jgi:4-amino-4-deoxy-L-arabinose transferase-like glycosyltransferase
MWPAIVMERHIPQAKLPPMNRPTGRASYGRDALLVGLAAFILFLFGKWQQPFIDFEVRFAVFAQEMWRHGITLFPTTYGEPYPDYPSTSTVLIYLASLPFGGVTKFSATLPTALAASINLALTYRLLAPMSRQWALATVAFMVMTITFLAEARAISLDQMVATIAVAAFVLAYTAPAQTPRILLLQALLIAIGFAIRGPLGVVVPAGVVCSYYVLSKQWLPMLRFGAMAAAIVIAGWYGMLALAGQLYGDAFVGEIVRMQAAARLATRVDPRTWSYYFTSSLGNYALAYPVALVVALITAVQGRSLRTPIEQRRLLLYLIGWVLVLLVGLSIPTEKKARSLLAITPAIAALAAYPFAAAPGVLPPLLARLRTLLDWLFMLMPLLLGAALAWAPRLLRHEQAADAQLHLGAAYAALAILQVAIIITRRRVFAGRQSITAVLAALAVWSVNVVVVEPLTLQLHDTSWFARAVEAEHAHRPADIAFFRVGKDGRAMKYLVNADRDLRPRFLADPAEVNALPRPAYVITAEAHVPDLRRTHIGEWTPFVRARFDGDWYVAFYVP